MDMLTDISEILLKIFNMRMWELETASDLSGTHSWWMAKPCDHFSLLYKANINNIYWMVTICQAWDKCFKCTCEWTSQQSCVYYRLREVKSLACNKQSQPVLEPISDSKTHSLNWCFLFRLLDLELRNWPNLKKIFLPHF